MGTGKRSIVSRKDKQSTQEKYNLEFIMYSGGKTTNEAHVRQDGRMAVEVGYERRRKRRTTLKKKPPLKAART